MHTTEWDRDLLRETLQEIMDQADLSQSAVGRLAGRDRTMANRWLKGQHQPNYDAAITFTQALTNEYPHLASLGERFLRAAGYRPATDLGDNPARTSQSELAIDPERTLMALRKIAEEQQKTIGDVLVERGLATRDELTLSEEKRGDRLVEEVLQSNLPEETKDRILMDYAERRRHHFREEGLIGGSEEK